MPAPDRQVQQEVVTEPSRARFAWLRRIRAWLARRGNGAEQSTLSLSKGAIADLDDLRYAYRLLLGREPDAEGFASHARRLKPGTLTLASLVESFIGSNEYAERHATATTPVEVRLDGYSVFVRPVDRDIGQPIREKKSYEPHVTSIVREVLRPGGTFVDIGANVGFFTAMAAHLVGPSGKVVAIEPMDKNVQLICAAVWRNEFAHVEIFPYAASDHDALLPIATGPRTSNGQIVLGDTDRPAIFAQARRTDDMLRHLRAIDLLKIDVEGHELLALRGFTGGLARFRPRMLTEFHPLCMRQNAGIEPAEYLAFLFGYGAVLEVLREDGVRAACHTPEDVLREWQAADIRYKSLGTTHVDLFVQPRD